MPFGHLHQAETQLQLPIMGRYVNIAFRTHNYWQASQDSGFSNEHATAVAVLTVATGTVAFAIFEAGRDRR